MFQQSFYTNLVKLNILFKMGTCFVNSVIMIVSWFRTMHYLGAISCEQPDSSDGSLKPFEIQGRTVGEYLTLTVQNCPLIGASGWIA
jgi:hypothetical protein